MSEAETGAGSGNLRTNLRYEDDGREEAHSLMTAQRMSTNSMDKRAGTHPLIIPRVCEENRR